MWERLVDSDDPAAGRAWAYRATAGERRTMHRHPELELNLVTSGRASYMLPDRRIDIDPGTLIWLYPKQDHLLINETPDFVMWIAIVRGDALERWCATPTTAPLREGGAGRQARRLDAEQARRLGELCDEAARQGGEADHLNATLRYLLMRAWRATEAASETPALAELHPAVEAATALLQRDGEAMSVPELAEASALSASRLSRLFKQQVGLSISDYRNRLRVDRFCRLYGRGERRTVLDAALEAGFGSYPQFHRAFKRHMGLSPAAHRRKLRGGEFTTPGHHAAPRKR
jgi:AraC-like DNA-binding protein